MNITYIEGKIDYAITDFLDALNWYYRLDLEGNYKYKASVSDYRMEYTLNDDGCKFYLIDDNTKKMIYHLKPEEYRYGVPKILEGLLKGYSVEWCGDLE